MTDVAAGPAVDEGVTSPASGPGRSAQTRRGRRKGLLSRYWTGLVGLIAVLVFLGAWQWAAETNAINPLFTSSPSRIWKALANLVATGQLWPNIWISGQEFLIGFGLSIVVAIPLGILIGWYRPVEAVFNPFVSFLNSVPRIALLPLLIIWVGIGIELKIAIVFLSAVVAILINTITGIKALDPQLITMARSFEASDFKIFRQIALPGSVPYILSGIRLGLGHALVGVVVGELYAANSGVGHLIAVAGNTFQIDLVFAGVVIIAVFGLIFTWLLGRLEQHFQSWRQ
ncbi:MAG TPA: ABC transporter permease [Actinocrinis sp.]|jgi:NitT/TauT family transport system permease protein